MGKTRSARAAAKSGKRSKAEIHEEEYERVVGDVAERYV